MEKTDKVILVTGATGRQGGAVVRHLVPKNSSVRALTRNVNSPAAKALAEKGAEVVRGDFDDRDSLQKATAGVYGVYSVQNFWETGVEKEIQQGKNMAEVAKSAGVKHFVYASVGGAERDSGVAHFESKWVIENYVRSLELPATFLRPVGYMENYYIPQAYKGLLKGKLVDPIRPDKPFQLIAVDDIGAFAALAFENPQEFVNLAIEIAGDEVTNPQVAQTFSRVMGRPVRFKKLPMLIVRLFMGKESYQMFKWFNEYGFNADINSLRTKYPQVKLTSLEDWLKKEGWDKKAAATK